MLKNMPHKPGTVILPDWIYDLSGDDQCLLDVLLEAGVASAKAHRAVEERGDDVPRTCSEELKAADGILDAIREGRTPRLRFAKKAAESVRKFETVHQCARFMERDDSPIFAKESSAPTRRVRVLMAREGSRLAQHARRGVR